jgi:hypothetical protein|tara:strand:- start:510 stop:941 length:432 start_codon:yes stop_codon:yes gene_type:complete
MATTTATLSIVSPDLIPSSPLNISATSTLMAAGTTTGLHMMESGTGELTVAASNSGVVLKEATTAGVGTAAKVYLCNKATDPTYRIQIKIHDTILGQLYAGDWMFIPWVQGDTDAEISVEAEGGTCPYEWAIFKQGETMVART